MKKRRVPATEEETDPIDTDEQLKEISELERQDKDSSTKLLMCVGAGCFVLAALKLFFVISPRALSADATCDAHPHGWRSSWRASWLPQFLDLCSSAIFVASGMAVWVRPSMALLWRLFAASGALVMASLAVAGASVPSALWLGGFNVFVTGLCAFALSSVGSTRKQLDVLSSKVYQHKSV